MSRPVLVAYASKHGSTAEVAEVVASSLVDRGLVVDVRPVGEVDDLSPYGGIVFRCGVHGHDKENSGARECRDDGLWCGGWHALSPD